MTPSSPQQAAHRLAHKVLSVEEQAARHKLQLREAGLRVTSVRLAILKMLTESRQAVNAQQVFDHAVAAAGKGKKPDRVTVYRTLNSLVEAGLAHRVDPGDRVFRFSLTDHEGCTAEHHVHEHPHFVCDSCGTVECMQGAEVVLRTPSESAGPARSARQVKQQDVVLHGKCGKCADDAPPKR